MYKGVTLQLTTGFATETLPARRKCQDILKVMKGKTKQNKTKTKTKTKKKTAIKINQQGYHPDLMEKSKALQISKS